MDSACLEMEENICLKLWVKLGCSPRSTQIVPKWHLDGQLAGTDFFNTRARRDTQKKFPFSPHLKLWVIHMFDDDTANDLSAFWVTLVRGDEFEATYSRTYYTENSQQFSAGMARLPADLILRVANNLTASGIKNATIALHHAPPLASIEVQHGLIDDELRMLLMQDDAWRIVRHAGNNNNNELQYSGLHPTALFPHHGELI